MENASKALIIAGAILISILLISVGVLIMNSTGGISQQVDTQADSMTMQAFNGQFTPYSGKKSAAQIKTLMSTVISSNSNNSNHQITVTTSGNGFSNDAKITGADESSEFSKIAGGTKNSYIYEVSLGYDDTGYITTITIN